MNLSIRICQMGVIFPLPASEAIVRILDGKKTVVSAPPAGGGQTPQPLLPHFAGEGGKGQRPQGGEWEPGAGNPALSERAPCTPVCPRVSHIGSVEAVRSDPFS